MPNRSDALFSFAWVGAVFLTAFGPFAAIAGLAQSTGFAASIPLARFIALFYADAASGDAEPVLREPLQWNDIGLRWWEGDGRATLMPMLAWNRLAEPVVLTDLLWLLAICPPCALLWRAVFSRSTRRTAVCWFAAGALAGAAALGAYLASSPYAVSAGAGNYAIYLAEAEVGVYVLWPSYALGVGVFALCIWAAGPALRMLHRAVPPPRTRA